jgi:hypothetical protein
MESAPNPPEPSSLGSTIGRLAGLLERAVSPGDLASLRRMQTGAPDCSAFWRLLALDVVALPAGGPARDEAERRWGAIVQAMATMAGQHAPGVALGRALAMADVAETRVLRLLRASGPALADAVRVTSHQLAQKALPSNHADLAALILTDGTGQ